MPSFGLFENNKFLTQKTLAVQLDCPHQRESLGLSKYNKQKATVLFVQQYKIN